MIDGGKAIRSLKARHEIRTYLTAAYLVWGSRAPRLGAGAIQSLT